MTERQERAVNVMRLTLPVAVLGGLILLAFQTGIAWSAHASAINSLDQRQKKTETTVETLVKIVDRLSWIEEQRTKSSQ